MLRDIPTLTTYHFRFISAAMRDAVDALPGLLSASAALSQRYAATARLPRRFPC